MALSFEVPPAAKKEEASLSHLTFFSHTCHTPLSLNLHDRVPWLFWQEEEAEEEDKKEDKTEDAVDEELAKKVLKAQLGHLASLRPKAAAATADTALRTHYERLAASLIAEHPLDLSVLSEGLAWAKALAPPATVENEAAWRAQAVSAASSAVTSSLDLAEIASYYGVNRDAEEGKEAKERKKTMDEKRTALRSALLASADALSKVDGAGVDAQGAFDAASEFAEAVALLKMWVQSASELKEDDDKVQLALTLSRYERQRKRPAAALAIVRKQLGGAQMQKSAKTLMAEVRALSSPLWTPP